MKIELCFAEQRQRMVRAMISFCRDSALAEDAVQQTFLKGVINRSMLEQMPPPAMLSWLYACARNYIIDVKRKHNRIEFGLLDNASDFAPDVDNAVLLEQSIVRLPAELQAIVRLRYYNGLNATEIGIKMNLPPATIRTRLRKAIALIRAQIQQNDA